jgi:hypothetical protein
MKYAFVECQRRQHSVRTLCRALRVSPSGYYASRSRPPSAREKRQSSLTTKIREVHLASRETYGAPRVHAELSVQGIACCRNTVAKLMRRAQIVPKAIRHFRVTTDSRNTKEVLPNLVRRCFKSRAAKCLLAQRCDLHPNTRGLAVPGGGSGCVFPGHRRLGHEPNAGRPVDHRRARYGNFQTWRSRARALRSRLNLRNLDIPGPHSEARDPPEHEPQGELLGHSI